MAVAFADLATIANLTAIGQQRSSAIPDMCHAFAIGSAAMAPRETNHDRARCSLSA
jgi:hypothetical protein